MRKLMVMLAAATCGAAVWARAVAKAEYDTGANAAFSANGAVVSNGLMILLR